MKTLLLILSLVLLATNVNAQLTPAQQSYVGSLPILLKNPSGENGGTGWIAGPTGSLSSTTSGSLFEGTRVLTTSLAAVQRHVTQDVTKDASTLNGKAALLVIAVRSLSINGLEVCARNDGANSVCTGGTSGVGTIPSDGSWVIREIPFIFSATSFGVRVKTTSAASGSFQWRVLYLNIQPPGYISNVVGNRIHSITWDGNNASWSGTSTVQAQFSVDSDATATLTGQALVPSTKIPGIRFPAGSYNDRTCTAKMRILSTNSTPADTQIGVSINNSAGTVLDNTVHRPRGAANTQYGTAVLKWVLPAVS